MRGNFKRKKVVHSRLVDEVEQVVGSEADYAGLKPRLITAGSKDMEICSRFYRKQLS
jgi:hypothetical protein